MYTLSCLQVAYDFLNREWIYLIYGDQKKTCYTTLKSRIGHFYCYILDLINPKNQINSKENYKFLVIVIITSLGVLFTAYKVMKILLSPEVKKSIMEFQWWRNENSNKMCPAFHENNNESSQITEDFPGGTSLTAIVKPTIRAEKMRKSLDLKCEHENSDVETSSESEVSESFINRINAMNFAGTLDFIKPLVKCSSSLRVATSKDSLNEEFQIENSVPRIAENKRERKVSKEINNNLRFGVDESSSIFDVDCVLSVQDNSNNPYQCSKSAFTSPDELSTRKNSSYASGHFVENFPDLDLSPIMNISKNKVYQQSVMTEFTDKEIAESKDLGMGYSQQKCLSERNVSNSLSHNSKCLEKTSDSFFSCWDLKSFLSGKKTPNRKNSKIPKLNFSAEPEEDGFSISKQPEVLGSKIPVLLKKFPNLNISAEGESNEVSKKSEPNENKADNLRIRESELSLQRFVQLEIATGCHNSSHFKHQSPAQNRKNSEKL